MGVCGRFFWWVGGKGVGTGQTEENYRLGFLGKPPALYQVPKLRNLIFFILRGLERGDLCGSLGGFEGYFWGSKMLGVVRSRGTIGLRSSSEAQFSIQTQS